MILILNMGYEYCGGSDSDKMMIVYGLHRYDCYSSDDSDTDIYTSFHRNKYSMLDNSSIENSSDSE